MPDGRGPGAGEAGAAPGPAAGRCGEVPPSRRSRDATGELRHDRGHETAPTWSPQVAIHAGLDAVARGDAQRPRHTDGPRPRTVHRRGGPAAASPSPDRGRARPTSVPSMVSSGKHWVVPALHELKLDRGSRAGRQDERGCTGADGTVGWFLWAARRGGGRGSVRSSALDVDGQFRPDGGVRQQRVADVITEQNALPHTPRPTPNCGNKHHGCLLRPQRGRSRSEGPRPRTARPAECGWPRRRHHAPPERCAPPPAGHVDPCRPRSPHRPRPAGSRTFRFARVRPEWSGWTRGEGPGAGARAAGQQAHLAGSDRYDAPFSDTAPCDAFGLRGPHRRRCACFRRAGRTLRRCAAARHGPTRYARRGLGGDHRSAQWHHRRAPREGHRPEGDRFHRRQARQHARVHRGNPGRSSGSSSATDAPSSPLCGRSRDSALSGIL